MRVSHTARGGHTGRATTFVNDSTPRVHIEALAEVLQHTNNEVPRWFEGMVQAPKAAPPVAVH
jgi:superfamily II DNA/RNA helicase